jgi:hypothetical protein
VRLPAEALVAGTVVLAATLAATARAQVPSPPALAEYAVLGVEDVTIRRNARVPTGAVGSVEGMVRLGRGARVGNAVAGPLVRLKSNARTGRLFCHLVSGPPVLPSCNAFVDPLVDPALLAPVPIVPGTEDLRIAAHTGTAPIPPGSFRDVRVGAGSVLQLAGGDYTAQSLRIGRRGRITCASACRIGVLGPVRLRSGARLGAASAQQADSARVDISGDAPAPVFLAEPRANVAATIFAPDGDIVLGRLGAYRGAFVGRTVTIAPDATVRGDSAL